MTIGYGIIAAGILLAVINTVVSVIRASAMERERQSLMQSFEDEYNL